MPAIHRLGSYRVTSFAAFFMVVSLLVVATLPARVVAQNASIGIYSDATGNSCSFTGDAPGLVTAYVVVRPDGNGLTGIQFAAPLPSCFAATYISETVPVELLSIGNSQTGISIALPACARNPVSVLQINYMQIGGTSPCCQYPIVADPGAGSIMATDCAFQDVPMRGVTSHFNADTSCECAGNSAPSVASSPNPQDMTSGISRTPIISWYASDIDGNLSDYDLYIGTTPNPPLVASGLPFATYFAPLLPANTLHYWRVVARDDQGLETPGPTWTFTTGASQGNSPPYPPNSPAPYDFQINVTMNPTLFWNGGDPDGDAIAFDVYFGTSTTPPLVSDNQPNMSYTPGLLTTATQYYWRIVVTDGFNVVSGPTWTFSTTGFPNRPPNPPANPNPGNGAANVSFNPLLSWTGSDLDGDPLLYDVYFGTTSPPPLASSNISGGIFSPGMLALGTTYYWQVVARDPAGLQTAGPIWSFQTRLLNSPPFVPSNPNPADGAVVPTSLARLQWSGYDPNVDPTTYDVYFGASLPLTLVATALPSPNYVIPPGTLVPLTTYYWKIVSSDGLLTTEGPTWSFATGEVVGKGDANGDGSLTWDDAICALTTYVYFGSPGCNGYNAENADVDCSGSVTPRDARCIDKHLVDGSCAFCSAAAASSHETKAAALVPTLYAGTTYSDGGQIVAPIFVAGVASLEALGFRIDVGDNTIFQGAAIAGATAGFQRLQTSYVGFPFPGFNGCVGGYSLSGAPAENFVLMLLLYFDLTDDHAGQATIHSCVDDLAGAAPITFLVIPNDTPNPVLISRFEAVRSGSDVEVRWDYATDEPIAGYTLYRRDAGAALPVAIEQGVDPSARSYVDRTVQASTTYRYELVVRTQTGGEYRSQTATVTTAAVTLSLGQNHPNPFNPQTTIPFDVPGNDTRVRLFVLDASGRVVRTLVDQNMSGGSHETVWNGRDARGNTVSSGVYFYVLDVGGERRTRKMVLLK